MSNADFLLELRSEEIPARMQAGARNDLARLFAGELEKAGLSSEGMDVFSTPRRLALIARAIPLQTQARSEELKGPRTSAPPQALEGFLRKTGLTREQLQDRDGVWFAVIDAPGQPTIELLGPMIERIVAAFPWPKSMRWGEASASTESLRWVRPLHGIVAMLGEVIVPVTIDGIESGATTLGHRFHHPGRITIGGPSDYAPKLRACHVIIDQQEREAIIRDGAEAAAKAAGLAVAPDEGLVVENAGLTEWPVPLLGRFDPDYLDVPSEVIVLTMRSNQKYFACSGGDGALAPAFVCVANIEAKDSGDAIVEGNRRVLAARLADARFFWEQDLKVPLEEQARKLSGIVFHEKLGTVAEKVERVAKLARWLAEEGIVKGAEPGEVERAARLAKADLVTGMVGEFPELQGVIGGYLARAQGEPDAVADAIRDHYRPIGQSDEVPTAPATAAIALADKLDTIQSFFSVSEVPTGSKDPFALRRAGLAVGRLILENSLTLNLSRVVGDVAREFLVDRHRTLLRQEGYRHDIISAVRRFGGFDLLKDTRKVGDLAKFLESENAQALVGGLKRVYNILRDAEQVDSRRDSYLQPSEGMYLEADERNLFNEVFRTSYVVQDALERDDYEGALDQLATLRPSIDAFFDNVRVNVGDSQVRENRLALLNLIRTGSLTVADFSELEG